MIPLIFLILMLNSHVGTSKTQCHCIQPEPQETTHWGGNEEITFAEKRVYKSVHGGVRDSNGEAMADVLIELFDNPEYMLLDYPDSINKKKPQRRIAACKTGRDGSFCFRNVPSGKYELRASKDIGFNPSHVYVIIDPKHRKSTNKGINVELTVGH